MTELPVPRKETDSLAPIDVPGDALWGAQTQRSLRFFDIGEQRMPSAIVHALAQIKRTAAEVNLDLGLLDATRAGAMATVATRLAAGEFESQFPLSVWQTGSGTQSNMNVNEVVANLASLASLRAALRAKAEAFAGVLKVGRTHLQDAAPLTFGQEFGGYEAHLALAEAAIRRALSDVHALAIGGTAGRSGADRSAASDTS